jgi:hypothetical protein
MPQVQAMLMRRYRRLLELQFSCWQAPPGKQACSGCEKCSQIALIAIADGLSPRTVGIDPVAVLCSLADWSLNGPPSAKVPILHSRRLSRDHIVRALQSTPTERAASLIASDGSSPGEGQARAIYARLRAEALSQTLLPEPGYVPDFLQLVDADLREPLRSILDQHYRPTSEPEFGAMSKRSRQLAGWIAEPLRRKGLSRFR